MSFSVTEVGANPTVASGIVPYAMLRSCGCGKQTACGGAPFKRMLMRLLQPGLLAEGRDADTVLEPCLLADKPA